MWAANARDQQGSEREKEQRVQSGIGARAGQAEQAEWATRSRPCDELGRGREGGKEKRKGLRRFQGLG